MHPRILHEVSRRARLPTEVRKRCPSSEVGLDHGAVSWLEERIAEGERVRLELVVKQRLGFSYDLSGAAVPRLPPSFLIASAVSE
jgi:hypothetical protein